MTHEFNGTNNNGKINVNGSFDVNVWYSYDNNTKTGVVTDTFNYNDNMNMKLENTSKLNNKSDIIVRSLTQPTVTDVKIENGTVKMNVQKELGIEVVGDTMVKVSVEEDEDDYEILEDDVSDEDIKNIDEEVDEDYLK
ncbi:MAG TPA: outer spore coat protein CotE [Bacilli bacterium]|nr:outer spore coat protein CotE [Bacilli bacterium]